MLRSLKFLFLCILLVATGQLALCQSAKFSVNSSVGCSPFIVLVTDLSGAHDTTAVNYDWGDGSPIDTLETHSYSQAGIYSIIQTVANANPRQDTMEIEVFDLYPPEFHALNCKNNVGSVFIEDNQFEAYEINWGDGNSEIALAYTVISHDYGFSGTFDVTVKGLINGAQTPGDFSNLYCNSTTKKLYNYPTISINPPILQVMTVMTTDKTQGSIWMSLLASTPLDNFIVEIRDQNQVNFTAIDTVYGSNMYSYTINSLNTEDNYYCARMVAFDPCDGQRIPSNELCSINLEATAADQQNIIEWDTEAMGFREYILYKDGVQLAVITDPSQTQFIDNQVNCGITYQYKLILNTLLSQSQSDAASVTSISTQTPDPIENVSATVNGQSIELNWDAPSNYLAEQYIISRSIDGKQYNAVDTVAVTSYMDENVFTQSTPYYYEIKYTDACGNISSASIIAQPILLIEKPEQILNWSSYKGWDLGVNEYILEKYDANGQLIESLPLGTSTEYQEDKDSNPYQFISYKITAVPVDASNQQVESNILKVIYQSKVAFPNAFSPDGDGTNDIFNFESRYIVGVSMKIYNRWGELIYQTTNVDKGWDGTINGKEAPIGTYIHHTELTDDMGITFVKTGEIVLIR